VVVGEARQTPGGENYFNVGKGVGMLVEIPAVDHVRVEIGDLSYAIPPALTKHVSVFGRVVIEQCGLLEQKQISCSTIG
jgi:hypothetical protein